MKQQQTESPRPVSFAGYRKAHRKQPTRGLTAEQRERIFAALLRRQKKAVKA